METVTKICAILILFAIVMWVIVIVMGLATTIKYSKHLSHYTPIDRCDTCAYCSQLPDGSRYCRRQHEEVDLFQPACPLFKHKKYGGIMTHPPCG